MKYVKQHFVTGMKVTPARRAQPDGGRHRSRLRRGGGHDERPHGGELRHHEYRRISTGEADGLYRGGSFRL